MTQIGKISFGPLYNSTLGFDSVFRDFERLLSPVNPTNFPPHNIYKSSEKDYYVEIATAGFSIDELEILVENDYLIIKGDSISGHKDIEYIHKGISAKSFIKKLKLLDTIKVVSADYIDGILKIHLYNNISENKQSAKIEINSPNRDLTKQLLTE